MRKKIIALVLVFTCILPLIACNKKHENSSNKVDKPDFYSFTDYYDDKVVLKEKPEKVAVLFSSYVDIWQTAGGNVDISVGESVERGFVDSDKILLVDSGAGKKIDNELLISYKPDFVICSADISEQVKTAELLRGLGIPCGVFKVESFDEYLAMLKICTDITENTKAYNEYGTDIQMKINDILSENKNIIDVENKKKILFIRAGSKASSTKAKTADENFVCKMLDNLGTYNIADNAKILLDGLSFEEVLKENPDYIFISPMGNEDAAISYMKGIFHGNDWQQLSAIKNNNYFFLPKDLFQFKPNSKWDKAYEYLIDLLNMKEK